MAKMVRVDCTYRFRGCRKFRMVQDWNLYRTEPACRWCAKAIQRQRSRDKIKAEMEQKKTEAGITTDEPETIRPEEADPLYSPYIPAKETRNSTFPLYSQCLDKSARKDSRFLGCETCEHRNEHVELISDPWRNIEHGEYSVNRYAVRDIGGVEL